MTKLIKELKPEKLEETIRAFISMPEKNIV